MKIGDRVKIIKSRHYPEIAGKIGIVKGFTWGDNSLLNIELIEEPPIGGKLWCFSIGNVQLEHIDQTVGANCTKCNSFNEYLTGPFTCWSCKNGS
jgi:hypothetical protein